MRKLFDSISTFAPWGEINIREWDESVKAEFSPYFESPSVIEKNREILRVELINLARIQLFSEYVDLLAWTLELYRSQLKVNKQQILKFMADMMHLEEKSDSAWMSLFQTSQPLSSDTTLYDKSYQFLSTIDALLEGCFKPRFQFVYSIAIYADSGKFPSQKKRLDFGEMRSSFPSSLSAKANLYLKDPYFDLGVNQWRNIGAHKTFSVITENHIELQYGLKIPPKTLNVSEEDLKNIIDWVIRIHTAVRLAGLIIYIENMGQIKPLLGSEPNLRIDQSLTRLCQGLALVGFTCAKLEQDDKTFILTLRCTEEKSKKEAVIHGSQMLDQFATAIEFDRLTADKCEFCAIKVFSIDNEYLGKATVRFFDVVEWTKGNLTMEDYIKRISFEIDKFS